MARTPNIQKAIESLIEKIGKMISEGVAAGIERSGLNKKLSRAGKRGRKPGRKPGRKRRKARKCEVRGCDEEARSKGMCSKHYQSARYARLHGGKVRARKPRVKAVGRKARRVKRSATTRGVAKKQISAKRKVAQNNPKAANKGVCSVAGCGRPVKAKGMCVSHFMSSIRAKKK